MNKQDYIQSLNDLLNVKNEQQNVENIEDVNEEPVVEEAPSENEEPVESVVPPTEQVAESSEPTEGIIQITPTPTETETPPTAEEPMESVEAEPNPIVVNPLTSINEAPDDPVRGLTANETDSDSDDMKYLKQLYKVLTTPNRNGDYVDVGDFEEFYNNLQYPEFINDVWSELNNIDKGHIGGFNDGEQFFDVVSDAYKVSRSYLDKPTAASVPTYDTEDDDNYDITSYDNDNDDYVLGSMDDLDEIDAYYGDVENFQ